MGKALSVPSLFQLGYYWEAKIFLTSVRLDVYTYLAEGPKEAAALANEIKADPDALARLLDALVAVGLLKKSGAGYENIPELAEFLVKSSPFYMGELMLLQDAEWDYWGKLETIVRTGRPVVRGNVFMNHPQLSETVLRVLDRMGKRVAPGLAEKIDLSACRTFLDVGGGAGTFSIAFCRRYPRLEATLFDLPQTLAVTRKNIEKAGLTERIRLIPGNFLDDPLPGPVDAVFLSDILHYQTEAENRHLFRKLYKATTPGGVTVVKDMFIGNSGNPGWNAVFSIHMMVNSEKGRCFQEKTVRAWLKEAGFGYVVEIERGTVLAASK